MFHKENVLPKMQSEIKKKKDFFYNHVANWKKAKVIPENF